MSDKQDRSGERYDEVSKIKNELLNLQQELARKDEGYRIQRQELIDSLFHLDKKTRYEAIVSIITSAVHQSIDIQEVLENAVDTIRDNVNNVANVSIYLVEGEEAVLKSYRGYPDWWVERVKKIPYPKGFTWKTIIEGRLIYCADAEKDTVIGPAGREMGTKSYASMPINVDGKTLGAVNINSLSKNAFDQDELNLLEILTKQIATAIKNATQAEALRQSEERYRTLFDQSPVGVFIFDKQLKIVQCNNRFISMLKSSYEEIIDSDIPRLKDRSFLQSLEKVFAGQSTYNEGFYEDTIGRVKLWLAVRLSPLTDIHGEVVRGMGVVEDITDRKQAEEKLIHVSTHDALTGLYNRGYFQEEISRLERGRQFPVSTVIVDLDGLKDINDTQGHETGDDLIRCAALVLKTAFRAEDVVARIGGDEFAVLLPYTDDTELEKVLARIRETLTMHNATCIKPSVSFSVGAATAEIGHLLSDILRLADERMYQEKSARKNARLKFEP